MRINTHRLNQSPTGTASAISMNPMDNAASPTDLGRHRHRHDLGHVAGAIDGS
ncbi:hypothetical protein KJ819_02840 [Patescibacteria group bacterium]|nr:hypothetical protein [Patescibacteria group bacterium]MBU1500787.1 hypothetical protein [Patescibacteria group bacterium]MBU2080842.1 hypothetical protein [Patescibacteria group bacterium]MBU2123947.1 hypothetical protein [Patescibacteria group bacterium]MBU2194762.1 hypothetical protein [Patescibacteria group bacterium]